MNPNCRTYPPQLLRFEIAQEKALGNAGVYLK